MRHAEILIVEDNPGDVRLTREAFKAVGTDVSFSVVENGVAALAFLHRRGRYADAPCPHLVLLDLNMNGASGWDVLRDIKADCALKRIPVIVLSGSRDSEDVQRAYGLYANCYIAKPDDFDGYVTLARWLDAFWRLTADLSN